ncbi:MAG: MMPL family transporter [Verrucomicrobia bacterium]|nr:MMPL family transporter [Verrucomicrobiota bacterium]
MIFSWFKALSCSATQHPHRTIAIAALLAFGVSSGIFRLQIRTDGRALASQTAPEVVDDAEIRGRFNIREPLVVFIKAGDIHGVFNPATAQLVRDLTTEFKRIPGVVPADVLSLATELNFRLRPGTMSFQTLLEPPLTTRQELDLLRDDLRQLKLYNGALVSADGRSTVILLGVPDAVDRADFYRQVLRIISAYKTSSNEIALTGALVAESLFGVQILDDLGVPRKLLGAIAAGVESKAEGWQIPRNLNESRLFVARHIGLAPLAALAMMIVLLLFFRSLPAALLPLPGVAATMLFVFGLMGWLGAPIYLTTAVMPVLLTVISVTNDIYLFSRYFALLRENPGMNHVALIEETFAKLIRPVVITSMAAVAGFLSFGFSPLAAVRSFGWFTAMGALFGLFLSLSLVPALLVLIPPRRLVCPPPRASKSITGAIASTFDLLAKWIIGHRGTVIGCLLALMSMTPFGLRRLIVQDSWTSGFSPESEFRRVTEEVNKSLFGMHLLRISVEASNTLVAEVPSAAVTPPSIPLPGALVSEPILIAGNIATLTINGSPQTLRLRVAMAAREEDKVIARLADIDALSNFVGSLAHTAQVHVEIPIRTQCQPEVIGAIAELESFIRSRRQYAVGGVIGPVDYLTTIRFMSRPGDSAARALPDNAVEAKLLWDFYASALGPQRLRQIVDTNYSTSLMTVFLKDANFVDTARLMKDIREFERDHLSGKGIRLRFAGDVAVSQSLIRDIVSTQIHSLIWSTLGIFLVIVGLAGSWKWGFYSLLPSLLAVAVKFAAMGWMSIPLGVATSMFAAMTLAIGANCAIHLMEAFTQAKAAGKPSPEAARQSLRFTGPPALVNTLAVSLGFGVLILSQVAPNARLGVLLVLGMVNCSVASLLVLPALLCREK